MATKKKGCGFLITALVLLIIGLISSFILGKGAYSEGEKFIEQTGKTGTSFKTPEFASYSATEDSEVTVWLTGNGTVDIDKVVIQVTETSSANVRTANKPSGTANFGNKHLVATIPVEAGKNYEFRASGIEDGRHLTVAAVSTQTALSIAGKMFGAIASVGLFGLLALIFGIIGLIKFLSSKSAPAAGPPPAAPPAP